MEKSYSNNDDILESDGDYDEDNFFDNYYESGDGGLEGNIYSECSEDPESFHVEFLTVNDVESLFAQLVNSICTTVDIAPSLVKLLLHLNNWDVDKVVNSYKKNTAEFLSACNVLPLTVTDGNGNDEQYPDICSRGIHEDHEFFHCPICTVLVPKSKSLALDCQHKFCIDCWSMYLRVKISEGLSTEITCMAQKCDILTSEDFVMNLALSDYHRTQYQQFSFRNYVLSHPMMRFCVGPDCDIIFKAKSLEAKKVICSKCDSSCCFKCGDNYHAPTDCTTIKNWLSKCADDSETANYFTAHTKDCPNCKICIEKNGGCNHMLCFQCKHEFCWICLGDWKGHGTEYYECSRYKDNPEANNESSKARAALKKYLHYYERWQNHAKSLKLEEKTLEKIKERITQKCMNKSGTWIDWQYLLDAAALLAKCRYTLQYTYPYAYYMKDGSKDLFEYQQGRLEAEIENLSWKIERAETTDRGDLENQMSIAEKMRKTLLQDFLQT